MNRREFLASVSIGSFLFGSDSDAQLSVSRPDSLTGWHTIKIGGGGFLTGIDIANDGTRVVRTDTYGAYLWEGSNREWRQVITMMSMPKADAGSGRGGAPYEIAIAPNNSSRLFMLYNGYVYRSDDKATTWTRTHFKRLISAASLAGVNPGSSSRTMGRKIAIDPANFDVVYIATGHDGVFVSFDAGSNFSHISTESIPAALEPGGQFPGYLVAFDPTSGKTNGKTNKIYVSSYGRGVFVSSDAGTTWTSTLRGPVAHHHLIVAQDGVAYLTDDSVGILSKDNIWKCPSAGMTWTRLSGTGGASSGNTWRSIAVDPTNAARIILGQDGGGLSQSIDYGVTWTGLYKANPRVATDIPWLAWTKEDYMSNGDMRFDPIEHNTLWFAEGIGVWYANLASDPHDHETPYAWNSQTRGIEQLVAQRVMSPPFGNPVIAVQDRGSFYVADPNIFPTTHGPNRLAALMVGYDLDFVAGVPGMIIGMFEKDSLNFSGISRDGGRTWTSFTKQPHNITVDRSWSGSLAASSETNFVWFPGNNGWPVFTIDGGNNWSEISVPGMTIKSAGWGFSSYLNQKIVAADRVTLGTFYAYNYGVNNNIPPVAGVYKSTDGGANWNRVYKGLFAGPSAFNSVLKSVPGFSGHLFFCSGGVANIVGPDPTKNVFLRSFDGAATWTPIRDILDVHSFGFGATKPDNDYPSIYIAGWLRGAWGFYRSDSSKAEWGAGRESWTLFGDYPLGNFDLVKTLDGDANVWGKCYVGFAGSGFVYFQP
jgi:hypothetical protein